MAGEHLPHFIVEQPPARRRKASSEAPAGEPLLLIQGWACGLADWGAIPKLLASAGRRPVISYDPHGIGESGLAPGCFQARSAEELARGARAVLRAAGVRRFHALGISLGGMVAQELAIGSSGEAGDPWVLSAILCATTPGGQQAIGPPRGFLDTFAGWEAGGPDVRRAIAEGFIVAGVTPVWAADHPGFLRKAVEHFCAVPREAAAIAAQARAVPAFDAGARLEGLGIPALVLHGELDTVFPQENAALLARRLAQDECSPKILPGCGHLLHLQQPTVFVKAVTEFLAAVESHEGSER